ncbi:thioesterase II family protein [Cryptosporangium japonicum]|uniref:thioesterase II family protein n=1 Tax=Cryptosporangium japonicum TaxID=80872 RepID=UPI0031D5C39B
MWLRRFHRGAGGEPAIRLIGLPHAGASASYLFPLSKALSPGVDVRIVQYPGRQDRRRDRCIEDIDELADEITAAVRPLTDAPIAFFGHSMGATLAFEIAYRLENDGTAVRALFVSGRRAPHRHREEGVHLLDDAGLIAELRRLSGTDTRILDDPETLEMILPALRSDYTAIERYRPSAGRTVGCPVHVLVGDDDPRTTIEEARAWRECTRGESDLTIFPGGHFYLGDQADGVVRKIRSRLAVD